MAQPNSKGRICEKCHQREATTAVVLSHEGPNVKFTQLCQQCLDAEQANGPTSLLGLLDQMEGKKALPQWVLVFELKRHGPRQADRAAAEKMWEAYQQGGWDMKTLEGRISRVFESPTDGEQMFEIATEAATNSWPVQGERSAYAVGSEIRAEYVVFGSSGQTHKLLTRVWIATDN
jgi:hypothetical protein